MKIRAGDRAPDFTLPSQDGQEVRLADFLGRKSVILYFYPKDGTPGCTAEAGAFRDSYPEFESAGAEVIGVSSDEVDEHRRFAEECRLPFTILSDSAGKVRKLYGVPSSLGIIPGRVTYIIDKEGIVRKVFSSQLRPTRHIEEALASLKELPDDEDGARGVGENSRGDAP